MKLIIGLGNPEEAYTNTRHNAGFLGVDAIRDHFSFESFVKKGKFFSEISEGRIGKEKITLAKPQTFMNLSGKAVLAITDFYNIPTKDIVVIHDDVDITLGENRKAFSSSSAGHNGVQNIIDTLGTKDFHRIRIGVGPTPENRDTSDFVLQKFSDDEQKILESVLSEIPTDIKNSLVTEEI